MKINEIDYTVIKDWGIIKTIHFKTHILEFQFFYVQC